ncbi:MAG TPA: alpha/beta fold hydrolase [Thermoanaerobaculia bacterium]|nr:alpha/beta fold hydrolase [Thermoanaerobaculia bacterium]
MKPTSSHRCGLCAFFLSIALAVGAASPSVAADPGSRRLPLEPCQIEGLEGGALCGTHEVWENRTTRQGRKIGLKVVVLPATGPEVAPDPLFLFAGGPGDGIASHAAGAAQEYAELRKNRDVVMVDQRGTGGSHLLQCDVPGGEDDVQGYFEPAFSAEIARRCRAELEKIADLTQYTTTIAADDLDEVRQWLGYGQINLEGASYGTLAAQVYLRRYPQHVRTATLYGTAGIEQYLPFFHARDGQRALDLLIEACLAEATCRGAFPNLRAEVREVLARLDRERARAEVHLPGREGKTAVTIARGPFAEQLRFLLYNPATSSLLPLVVHEAHRGNFEPFATLNVLWQSQIRRILAFGMHLSVTCAEDLPFGDQSRIGLLTEGTYLGDYRIRQQLAACAEWPRAAIPPDFHQPVRSDVPVLLISGNVDPVTPPFWAEETVRFLPRGRHFIVPDGHHGYGGLANPECLLGVGRTFIERGEAESLDGACLSTMKRGPFVTSLEQFEGMLKAMMEG